MKLTIRKPTHSEIYMYKNLFWVAVLLFVFIPLLSSIVIYPVSLAMQNNVAYKSVMPTVNAIGAVLSFIGTYGGFGVLAVTVCYFGNNGIGIIRLALLSNLISYLSLWTVHILINPYADEGGSLITMAVEILINTAFVAILYFAVLVYAKRRRTFMDIPNYGFSVRIKKHPFTGAFLCVSIIYFVINIAIELATMISQFLDPSIGLPRNNAEILTLVSRYGYVLLYTVAGMAVMMLIGVLASALRKRGRVVFSKNQGLVM